MMYCNWNILIISHKNLTIFVCNRDLYDVRRVTEHHILRLFAFATLFVRLLRQGLRTYDSPRYRQFAKRLGRLIRHTVQYASDVWEGFRFVLTYCQSVKYTKHLT